MDLVKRPMVITDFNYNLVMNALWVPFHAICRVKVEGLEKLKYLDQWKKEEGLKGKGLVGVINHGSHLDPFSLVAAAIAVAKQPIHFITKYFGEENNQTIKDRIYNSLYYRTGQIVFKERETKGSLGVHLKKINWILNQGRHLYVFSEGGILGKGELEDDGLGIFDPGAARIAYSNHTAIIPIRLDGVNEIMPHGAMLPKRYGKISVKFGELINPRSGEYGNGKLEVSKNVTEVLRRNIVKMGK